METNHKIFKPYEKVLIKATFENNYDYKGWTYDLYSHWDSETNSHICVGSGNIEDYNILSCENNEYLVGTTNDPEEKIKLEEGEYIMVADEPVISQYEWLLRRFVTIDESTESFTACAINDTFFRWKYIIRFSDFNPSNMEETRKHMLYVKNGRIVRYKE